MSNLSTAGAGMQQSAIGPNGRGLPMRVDRHLLAVLVVDRRDLAVGIDVGVGRPGLVAGQRARALQDPDVVVPVDRDAADLSDDPVVGQRLAASAASTAKSGHFASTPYH